MKLKNIIPGLGLIVLGLFAQAQNGLENILVERYYVSTAADAVASMGTLPEGSVTYRIYADMLPGYKLSAVYGNSNLGVPVHALKIQTSTSFFNNEDRGATTPSYTKAQAALNTVMLDSWLSVGAGCTGNFGVPLSEDNGIATVVHPEGVLTELSANDGLLAGTPEAVTFVGPQVTDGISIFDGTSQAGKDFIVIDGAWSALNGAAGPIPETNRVLIGQFTTDGIFHFELNLQILSPTDVAEKYVTSNAVDASETVKSFLTQTLNPALKFPVISLTAPENNASYVPDVPITLTASASDADGTVTQVEFFVDNVSIGLGTLDNGTATFVLTAGLPEKLTAYSITAKATDNDGQVTTSDTVSINVVNTGIDTKNQNNRFSVYPNPSSDKMNIEVSSDAKVQILDLNGKAIGGIRNVKSNEKQVIDVKNLAAGVYMVKIYNDKFVKTQRVVVNK